MRLFISYAHIDRQKVSELVDVLREAAYDPWFDHRLMPGQNWKSELLNAIRICETFVYALTPDSARSEWCQWEFAQAVKMGKPVIPVLLQAHTPLPEAISQYQYADFTEGATPRAVARLMGGLRIMAVVVPPNIVPPAPIDPAGYPAQAYGNGDAAALEAELPLSTHPRLAPEIAPDDYDEGETLPADDDFALALPPETSPTWSVNFSIKREVSDILPPLFEWCKLSEGRVTLPSFEDQPSNHLNRYVVGAFEIARFPITNAQYQVFVRASDGYSQERWWDFSDGARAMRAAHPQLPSISPSERLAPCTQVSWYDALAFCFWLNWKAGLAPKAAPYTAKGVITLPSEQQWQYAAQENIFGKSPLGVSEWCLTTYDTNGIDLRSNAARVLCSSSYRSPGDFSATSRIQAAPDTVRPDIGFRVAHAVVSSD